MALGEPTFRTPDTKKNKIEDSKSFLVTIKKALLEEDIEESKNLLCQAEEWLNDLKETRNNPKYFNAQGEWKDDEWNPKHAKGRWVDHTELPLFRAYREIKDFDGANRVIESMEDTEHAQIYDSKAGRIKVLSKEINRANSLI